MNTRAKFLALCLFEGLRNINEEQQMMQQQQAAPVQPQQQPPVQQQPSSSGGQSASELIGRLDSIRGGKSLSDPAVYSNLEAIVKSMPPQEFGTIDKFLSAVEQAVSTDQNNQPPAPAQQGSGAQPPMGSPTPQPTSSVPAQTSGAPVTPV